MAGNGPTALPFEAPLQELKQRIEELRNNVDDIPGLQDQLKKTEEQHQELEHKFYSELSPWNTVQLARHPDRPQVRDYVELAFDEFFEMHGDRQYRDDLAIVTGLARIGDHRVMLVGQHKGRNVDERHICHAGCPHPEGYWKALRKMKIAERFNLPVICLIDTKGAYPGIGSEERGVAIAIAENLLEMSRLKVPIICVVIGEGGSGGALGIGVGDRILMLKHSYYSVISPEGCASILWRDGEKKAQAAAVLKLTSRDLKERGFVDQVVDEPLGGAHRDKTAMGKLLRDALISNLDELVKVPAEEMIELRYKKYCAFGDYLEGQSLPPMPEPTPEPKEEEDVSEGPEDPEAPEESIGSTEDMAPSGETDAAPGEDISAEPVEETEPHESAEDPDAGENKA